MKHNYPLCHIACDFDGPVCGFKKNTLEGLQRELVFLWGWFLGFRWDSEQQNPRAGASEQQLLPALPAFTTARALQGGGKAGEE